MQDLEIRREKLYHMHMLTHQLLPIEVNCLLFFISCVVDLFIFLKDGDQNLQSSVEES